MRAEATVRAEVCEIATPAGEDYFAFPLTSMQASMWPRDLPSASDPSFNGAFRMSLAGKVDASLLEQSLREIAQRHEILRATFRIVAGEVQQVIFPNSNLTIDTLDLRLLPADKRMAELDEICLREARTEFDLTKGTPIRSRLLCLEDEHFILTLTIHQILCDGWSIGILMEELSQIYSALAKHELPTLRPLDFQYGDYAVWQVESSKQALALKQLDFWKKKLAGYPQTSIEVDLAGDRRSIEGDIVSELLPRDLTDGLRNLGQAHNATFFVVAMAACMALLNRYTGESDLALRSPLAGRTRVEFEPIIGQFANQVAIRTKVLGSLSFTALIAQTREAVWEALANQDIAFEQVLKNIAAPNQSTADLFKINFVCQREYGRSGPFEFDLDGVKTTTLPSKSQGALYDLNFFLVERAVGWRLSLEYRTALYTKTTAEDLLRHFQEILRQVVTKPELRIDELALSPTEALTTRIGDSASLAASAPALSGNPTNGQELEPLEVTAMPASFAQERFWALSQIDPSGSNFNIPVVIRLNGSLSMSRLEQSFQQMIDRHETLRTTFSETNGELLQVISPAGAFALQHLALDHLDMKERTSRLTQAIHAEVQLPFDLSKLPLMRTLICRLSKEEHVLIITIHHILADARSVQIIQEDLWTIYESLRSGQEAALNPPALQYGDFSVWQKEQVHSEAMKAHLDFWLKRLAGDLPVLNFPTDRPPAYKPTSQGALETLLLPEFLTHAVKEFARSQDTTLYVVTLACFAALLSRASDAEDLVVGSPVLNRQKETEHMVGPLAGPIALRLNLSGNPTLSELIVAARESTLEALDHAELPFEVLLKKLTLRTQNGHNPLFQFYFLCQTAFLQSRELPDLTITPLPRESTGTPFELQLAVIERREGVRAELEYNTDLFDHESITEWLDYYVGLLSQLIRDPNQRVSELPALPFQQKNKPHTAQRTQSLPGAVVSTTHPGSYIAPHDLVEEMVAQVWESVLGIRPISVNANFFDLGGTSLLILRLIPRINAAFRIVLPVPTIFTAPTIEKMANVLRQRHEIESQVVLPLQPAGARPPLFMIHSYHLYRALPAALGNDQPLYGVLEPELSRRTRPYTLKDQVANYVKHIREIQPQGPYYIAGFCFFALLAFEVAAQLESQGEKVAFVGLIDAHCPEYWIRRVKAPQEAGPDRAGLWARSGAVLRHNMEKARSLSIGKQLSLHANFLLSKLRNRWLSIWLETRINIYAYFISRDINLPKWLKERSIVTRVAVRRHTPAMIKSNLYLFPAQDQPFELGSDATLGWGAMTSGEVKAMWIPGDHEDMFLDNHIEAMAETIKKAMSEASK